MDWIVPVAIGPRRIVVMRVIPVAIGPVRIGAVVGGFDGYPNMRDGG